jgi:hypothetical protein
MPPSKGIFTQVPTRVVAGACLLPRPADFAGSVRRALPRLVDDTNSSKRADARADEHARADARADDSRSRDERVDDSPVEWSDR